MGNINKKLYTYLQVFDVTYILQLYLSSEKRSRQQKLLWEV